MPSKKSLLVTLVQSMRASWHFGGATKAHSEGGAFREYGSVLSLLSHPRVDPGMPIARSVLVLSLVHAG